MASLNAGSLTGLPESHRNSPLAPSQEMSYRQKCIDLKRRLSEIEANNDSIRQRLARERRFQDKMRLNRAILLNHMKELVESPSKAHGEDKMKTTSASVHNRISALRDEKGDGFAFEDSSEISSGDEVKEVCRHSGNAISPEKRNVFLIFYSQNHDLYVQSAPATVRLEHQQFR